MQFPPTPPDELARLRELRSYDVLDTPAERAFDDLTELASKVCGVQVSLVSLVDEHRQWFKSHHGLDATETPRELAFCAHAILRPEDVLIVEDAREDERFHDNPLVTDAPNVTFYAGAPLVSPSGHSLGTLCVIDSTPRKLDEVQISTLRVLARQVVTQLELRKRLRQLDESRAVAEDATVAKSRFLANMSHEIRTPLNAILGMSELLYETQLSGEQAQYVSVFRNSGQTLLELINDILDLSKVEAGKIELVETEFRLQPFLESVVEALAFSAGLKGLDVALDVEPGVPTRVSGDELRLRQVIVNLMGNAIKFTERGHVVLRVGRDESDPQRLEFCLSDTGIGIPPESVARLFDPFTQVDASSERRHGGTGLGLTLSKELVELMGGRLAVESTLGVGSTFAFAVRLAAVEEDEQVRATDGRRVLLVDDSSTERRSMRHLLERLGCTVTEADGGAEGLSLWSSALDAQRPHDVVLIDLRMPAPNGLDVAQEMRTRSVDLGRALMLLPPNFRRGDVDQCDELGLGGCLVKPVRQLHLERALAALLAGRRAPLEDVISGEEEVKTAPEVSSSVRILLAEDCAENRFVVQSYLKNTSHRIECAEDGNEAVRLFKAQPFDLVLMDMQLPGCNGYQATAMIREWEREEERTPTPILALTADAMQEDRQRALEAGCDAHLCKPILKRTLLDAIATHALAGSDEAQQPAERAGETALDEIAAIRPVYLRSRRADLGALLAARDGEDLETIRRLGHNMKGSGASFGFPDVSDIGASIEHAAKTGDLDAANEALERLRDFLDRTQQGAH